MNKSDVLPRENILLTSLKTVLKALLFTVVALLILTAFMAYGDISEETAVLCVKTATFLSMFLAGFMTARARRRAGIVSGFVAGSVYVLIMILAGVILQGKFSLSGNEISMYLMSVLSSMAGGIFGVNFKKKIKKR